MARWEQEHSHTLLGLHRRPSSPGCHVSGPGLGRTIILRHDALVQDADSLEVTPQVAFQVWVVLRRQRVLQLLAEMCSDFDM